MASNSLLKITNHLSFPKRSYTRAILLSVTVATLFGATAEQLAAVVRTDAVFLILYLLIAAYSSICIAKTRRDSIVMPIFIYPIYVLVVLIACLPCLALQMDTLDGSFYYMQHRLIQDVPLALGLKVMPASFILPGCYLPLITIPLSVSLGALVSLIRKDHQKNIQVLGCGSNHSLALGDK